MCTVIGMFPSQHHGELFPNPLTIGDLVPFEVLLAYLETARHLIDAVEQSRSAMIVDTFSYDYNAKAMRPSHVDQLLPEDLSMDYWCSCPYGALLF